MAHSDQWKPQDLADCAKKHIEVVPIIKERNLQVAMYIAGIACEAMFRSLRYINCTNHNSRHNIIDLAKECGYVEKIPFSLKGVVSMHLQTLGIFWWNELRYANKYHQIRYYMRSAAWQRKKTYTNLENDLEIAYNKVYNAAKTLIEYGVRYANI